MRWGLRMLAAVGGCAALAGCGTLPATDVTATGATLRAQGLTGAYALDYWFEYSPTTRALDSRAGVRTPTRFAAANTPSTTVGEPVTGLEPNTIYYYRACGVARGFDPAGAICLPRRAVATDGPVAAICGREPVCETLDPDPAEITDTTAVLRGRGFAGTAPAEYWFEYTPNGSLDPDPPFPPTWRQTPHRPAPTTPTELREPVEYLPPLVTMQVRLCARLLSEETERCFEPKSFEMKATLPPAYEKTGGRVRATGSQDEDRTYRLKDLDIDVHSGQHGEDPGGHASFTAYIGGEDFVTTGRVACVDVKGSAAVINIVRADGEVYTILLEDHGASGDVVDALSFGRAEEDCGPRRREDFFRGPLTSGGVVIEPAAP